MTTDISILIVSYNSGGYLKACIESILASETQYTFETVVVDNNSTDNTIEILKSFGPKIKWFGNDYNFGFAKGMNQAMRIASGRYILTFNPDAELLPNSIEIAVNYLKQQPAIGILAPLLINTNGQKHLPNYNLPVFDSSSTIRFFLDKFSSKEIITGPKEVNFVFGTGLVVDRTLLKNDNLYPEDTFLFWEEYYLAKQAQVCHKTVVIIPQYLLLHHRSVSFKFNKQKIEWMQKLILPYGFYIRVNEHGKLFATLNYLYKSLDSLIFWSVLQLLRLIGIQKYSLRLTAWVNIGCYWKSIFMSKDHTTRLHKEAMVYFNQGKKPSSPNI